MAFAPGQRLVAETRCSSWHSSIRVQRDRWEDPSDCRALRAWRVVLSGPPAATALPAGLTTARLVGDNGPRDELISASTRADSPATGGASAVTAIAGPLVLGLEIDAGLGLLFAIAFAARGIAVVDPAARGAPLGFRLLVLPASAALWPWLAFHWLRGAAPRDERNAHRDAARRRGRSG
jgi:hypothetical protein